MMVVEQRINPLNYCTSATHTIQFSSDLMVVEQRINPLNCCTSVTHTIQFSSDKSTSVWRLRSQTLIGCTTVSVLFLSGDS